MPFFDEPLSRLRRANRPAYRRPRSVIGAAAVATGVAVILGRRRAGQGAPSRSGTSEAGGVASGPRPAAAGAPDGERSWNCQCGQEYRVQGVDRHRVYWLAGADVGDPVLEAECPKCGTTLPREHEHPESVQG